MSAEKSLLHRIATVAASVITITPIANRANVTSTVRPVASARQTMGSAPVCRISPECSVKNAPMGTTIFPNANVKFIPIIYLEFMLIFFCNSQVVNAIRTGRSQIPANNRVVIALAKTTSLENSAINAKTATTISPIANVTHMF